jgi:hypothetical protein
MISHFVICVSAYPVSFVINNIFGFFQEQKKIETLFELCFALKLKPRNDLRETVGVILLPHVTLI